MLTFTKQEVLKEYLRTNFFNKEIGFVPTMGALHKGHLSLIEASLAENNVTVISIFVNPTQFNSSKDLDRYPRTLKSDIEKIASISDKILIYTPEIFDIYGKLTVSQIFDFDGLELQMEGKHRPGHFDGVGTVVKKLFEIVCPTRAYFGEKDFQQLQIIKKLVEILKLNVKVVQVPIFREKNGLAMSSRNERLSDIEREQSAFIYKTLYSVKNIFKNESAFKIRKWVRSEFEKNKIFELEYFEIADEKNLLPCKRKSKIKNYRAFIAVVINNVRLIDTIAI